MRDGRFRSIVRFEFILGVVAGASYLAFANFRAEHPIVIATVEPIPIGLRVQTSEPATLRVYDGDVPVAEATADPHEATNISLKSSRAHRFVIRATTADGRTDTLVAFGDVASPPAEPAIGAREIDVSLAERRISFDATVTLPRSDERVEALFGLGWPVRSFVAATTDAALKPSPRANEYYEFASFLRDPAVFETTDRGGDVTVHVGTSESSAPAEFPATDRIALVLRLPWLPSNRPFRSDIVKLQFEDEIPTEFDPFPDSITADGHYVWRGDARHPLDQIVIGLQPAPGSLAKSARDFVEAQPRGRWMQLAYSAIRNLWAAAPVVMLALFCRRAVTELDPARRAMVGALAGIAFGPAVSDLVGLISLVPRSPRWGVPGLSTEANLYLATALAGVIVFVFVALALIARPRARLGFAGTLSLVVATSAAVAAVDAAFYDHFDDARWAVACRDAGSAVAMCSTMLLLWWTLRPYMWLRRLPRFGPSRALLAEIGLLVALSWPAGRNAFLPPMEPLPAYAGAADALRAMLYPLADAGSLLFGLLFLITGLLQPLPDAPIALRRRYAAALIALFAVGTRVTVGGLPIPALIAFGVAFVALVLPGRWAAIEAIRARVVAERARYVAQALDLREAERIDQSLESLNDQFTSGSLGPDGYNKRVSALGTKADELRGRVSDDAAIVEQLAFGAGSSSEDLGNGCMRGYSVLFTTIQHLASRVSAAMADLSLRSSPITSSASSPNGTSVVRSSSRATNHSSSGAKCSQIRSSQQPFSTVSFTTRTSYRSSAIVTGRESNGPRSRRPLNLLNRRNPHRDRGP